jgi:HD superfamily phosphohydrolase
MAKYYLTTNVYRLKTCLIADHMIVRAIQLGIEKDQIEDLISLYRFDNTDRFVERYCQWDDGRFLQEFCVTAQDGRCKKLLDRLVRRRLLKRVFAARLTDFQPDARDGLPQLTKPERTALRASVEAGIAEILAPLLHVAVDADQVIVNIFSIRSVRETSRNDEAGILVAGQTPEPFVEASRLFASINERYTDEFVEVYAPVEWATDADKHRIRRQAREPILRLIEERSQVTVGGTTA